MLDLLVEGGLYFTIPLTIIAILMLAAAIGTVLARLNGRLNLDFGKRAVFHLGLFGFVFGAFSHGLSLYQMMQAIELAGGVSPALVAGGLKVSLIAPLYGLGIFLTAMLLWFVLDRYLDRRRADYA